MASFASEVSGPRMCEFFNRFGRFGGTSQLLRRLNGDDALMRQWIEGLTELPSFKLDGLFIPILDVVELVRTWPGINQKDVDVALAYAMTNGLLSRYQVAVKKNPLLCMVVNVTRESVPATLLYVRERMRESLLGYNEWREAFVSGVDDKRVRLINNARPFKPNHVSIEVIDLGANWEPNECIVPQTIQATQADKLAGFEVLYAAVQHSGYLPRIDFKNVPAPFAGAVLLNVQGYGEWTQIPVVVKVEKFSNGKIVGYEFTCCRSIESQTNVSMPTYWQD